MNELHDKLICDDIFVLKGGQRGLLCSNEKSYRCPSLVYEHVEDIRKLNEAYDLLFDILFENNNQNHV